MTIDPLIDTIESLRTVPQPSLFVYQEFIVKVCFYFLNIFEIKFNFHNFKRNMNKIVMKNGDKNKL